MALNSIVSNFKNYIKDATPARGQVGSPRTQVATRTNVQETPVPSRTESTNDHCGPCGYDKLGYKIEEQIEQFKQKQAEGLKLLLDKAEKQKKEKINDDLLKYIETLNEDIKDITKCGEMKQYYIDKMTELYKKEAEKKEKKKGQSVKADTDNTDKNTEEYILTQSITKQEKFYTKPFIENYSQYLLKPNLNRFKTDTAKNPSLFYNNLEDELKDYFVKSINITRSRKPDWGAPFCPE